MYIILIIVMFVWGMNLPAVKYLTAQMDPVMMTALRIFLASLTVFFILSMLKLVRYPKIKEWPYIVGGALLNVVIHHYFLSVGLTMTTGTNAGLIMGTGPILTAIFSLVLLRIYPSKLQWFGFLLGIIGVWSTVVAGSDQTSTISLGDSFVLIAIVSQVLSFIIIKKVSKTLDPRLLTAYMFLIGSFLLFSISLVKNPGSIYSFQFVPSLFWPILFASGIMATAIGHMLYNYSVGYVGPAKTSAFMNLSTLFSILGAVFFLGEQVSIIQIIGLVFIVCGVLFGSGAAEVLWQNRKSR